MDSEPGLSRLLAAVQGLAPDPLRTGRRVTPGSRCYSRPLVEPVELSHPAELHALDALHPLKLPAGVWIVTPTFAAPRFDHSLPRMQPELEAA